jgi:hypothetical protein
MPVTLDKPAPYATSGAILELIERHRTRGLPSPVTPEILGRAGIAETLIPRTLQTLHILDLIDAKTGMPTETFEGLRLAPEPEFKNRLADWLKGAYADVFAFVDPTKDDETSIRDAFRSYQPVGQQQRMTLLFEGLCAAAGLIPERPAKPRATTRLASQSASVPQPKRVTSKLVAAAVAASSRHASRVPPPIAGLLESLPPQGEGWTKEARDKFMATFGTVLDYCFPFVKSEKESGGQKTAA